MQNTINEKKTILQKNMNLLDAYSPLKVLSRGYSIVKLNGTAISDASMLHIDDEIEIRMHSGSLKAAVQEIKRGV